MSFLVALVLLSVAAVAGFSTPPTPDGKVPIIFDMDANYDDTLALLYIAHHPGLDLKAVTVAGAGFATYHGGPMNMLRLLNFLGESDVPVSFGPATSLSPLTTFPLQWRIEIDLFYEREAFEESDTPVHVMESPDLIAHTLRTSPTKVAVLITGPATNLAIALRKDPSLVNSISAIYLMGSNYGGGPNNVYDWQMAFNGVAGSCSEDALAHDFTPTHDPLNLDNLGFAVNGSDAPNFDALRPGCRGVNMNEAGDTEWNVFLDALAWHVVARFVATAEKPPMVYALATGASEEMAVTIEDFEEGVKEIEDEELSGFIVRLAQSFLGAGEAKWWDAATIVSLVEIISGYDEVAATGGPGVCSEWAHTDGFMVSLTWKSEGLDETNKLPYGSIIDKPSWGPVSAFCTKGDADKMQEVYWATLADKTPESHLGVANPEIFLAPNKH